MKAVKLGLELLSILAPPDNPSISQSRRFLKQLFEAALDRSERVRRR